MLELLVKVMDLEGRTRLVNEVFLAWTSNDKKEMLKVLNALNSYLESQSEKSTSHEAPSHEKPSSEEDLEEKARELWGYYI
jgi:hypothetical protein